MSSFEKARESIRLVQLRIVPLDVPLILGKKRCEHLYKNIICMQMVLKSALTMIFMLKVLKMIKLAIQRIPIIVSETKA